MVKRPDGNTIVELWYTDEHPVDDSGYEDPGIPNEVLDAGKDGSLFHIVIYPRTPSASRRLQQRWRGASRSAHATRAKAATSASTPPRRSTTPSC